MRWREFGERLYVELSAKKIGLAGLHFAAKPPPPPQKKSPRINFHSPFCYPENIFKLCLFPLITAYWVFTATGTSKGLRQCIAARGLGFLNLKSETIVFWQNANDSNLS